MNELISKVVTCYDNGGETFDRYTVIYLDAKNHLGPYDAVGMSEAPFHPQGFGQHCSASPGPHLGRVIYFDSLPIDCQRLVNQDLGIIHHV